MRKKKLEKIIKQNQKDIDNLYSLIAKLALQNKDYRKRRKTPPFRAGDIRREN